MKLAQVVALFLTFLFGTLTSLTRAEYVQEDSIPTNSDEQVVKRPFCNAFTGCGRKRSDDNDVGSDTEALLQSLGQQILRQAKLRGLQTSFNSYGAIARPKSKFQSPWLDFLGDRKKRMVTNSDVAHNNNNKFDTDNVHFGYSP